MRRRGKEDGGWRRRGRVAHRSMVGLGRENQMGEWRNRVVEDKEEEDGEEYMGYTI